MNKKTIRDVAVKGKRVFMRVDFNVPLDRKTNAITDDTRIRAELPTIEYLIKNNARIILSSHLGRPDGKVVNELKLAPVGKRLSELIKRPVKTLDDCIGPRVESAVNELREGEIILLENLRFHSEEEKNDPEFARALSRLGDIVVNDAFGLAHRAHASNVGITSYLPAVAGFLMQKELDMLGKALDNPVRPLLAVVGGAKVTDKIKLLDHIMDKVDVLLVGGGMMSTFLRAQEEGAADTEEEEVKTARRLLDKAKHNGARMVLAVDAVITDNIAENATTKIVPLEKVEEGWKIADIGPRTIEIFSAEIKKCKTAVWNGPMGVFEIPEFSNGTKSIANVMANIEATTIICGGSTGEAVQAFGLADKMNHVSTGGGASLRFLEGEVLPGVAALQDK